jgi:hypothetical protein
MNIAVLSNRIQSTHKTQRGIVGIFLSAILSAALVVAGAQGTKTANMNAYHTGNKSSIEEATQLMLSGLRHTSAVLQDKEMLQALLDQYANNPNVIMSCGVGKILPETLVPTEVVASLWTPEPTQEIRIKAIFAPYDCYKDFSRTNFRVAFEVTGGSGCNGSTLQNSELCATRAVVMSAYKGTTFNNTIDPVVLEEKKQKEAEKKAQEQKRSSSGSSSSSNSSSSNSSSSSSSSSSNSSSSNSSTTSDSSSSSSSSSSTTTKKSTNVNRKVVGI